jgi:hypothetical protein
MLHCELILFLHVVHINKIKPEKRVAQGIASPIQAVLQGVLQPTLYEGDKLVTRISHEHCVNLATQ